MILDTQKQESVAVAVEVKEQFVFVQDLDLVYVSGGGAEGVLF